MAIIYDIGTNILRITEGTEGAPITLQDIYDADVAGGWGVVTKQGEGQYRITAKFYFGDGFTTTWFKSIRESLEQAEIVLGFANATVQFGEWDSTHSVNGSHVKFTKEHTSTKFYEFLGTLKIYGCLFDAKMEGGTTQRIYLRGYAGSTVDFRETHFNNFLGLYFAGTDCYVENCILWNNSYGYYLIASPSNDWTKVITNAHLSYWGATGSCTVYELDAPVVWMISPVGATGKTLNLVDAVNIVVPLIGVNCDYDTVYYKYQFNLHVIEPDNTNIADATVKIWDYTAALVVDTTTDVGGDIAEQELVNRKYYGLDETLTMYTPHIIQISKSGYETYYGKVTVDEPMDLEIILKDAIKINLLDGFPIYKLDSESWEDSKRKKFIEL